MEANAIKAAYSYYLASGRAKNEVENTTQTQLNLKTVNATLRRLYREFEDLKNRLIDERCEMIDKEVSSSQCSGGIKGNPEPKTLNQKQQCSLQTAKAIMLFNMDSRFSITE